MALARREFLYRTALKAEDYKFAFSVEVDRSKLLQLYDAVVISVPKPVKPPRVEDIVALFPRTMRARVRARFGVWPGRRTVERACSRRVPLAESHKRDVVSCTILGAVFAQQISILPIRPLGQTVVGSGVNTPSSFCPSDFGFSDCPSRSESGENPFSPGSPSERAAVWGADPSDVTQSQRTAPSPSLA